MPTRPRRAEKLDLRLTRDAKQTIQAAAATLGRSVSDFVVDSALTKAGEALADRKEFILPAKQWKAFVTALDAPGRALPRLKRLMTEPSAFDVP